MEWEQEWRSLHRSACSHSARWHSPRRSPRTPSSLRSHDQQNTDGGPDGDACECGDADRDGDVDGADGTLLRNSLRGAAALPAGSLCDTNHDAECTNADVTRIEAFSRLVPLLQKQDLSCREKVGPGPQPGSGSGEFDL